jgi:N-6 DNA Methylase/TaqI-like C-terminal specificity domain
MNLFNKKTIARAIAFPKPLDPHRQAALKQWADSITSGTVEQHKEVALHGAFTELMVKAFGYTGAVGNDSYTIAQEQAIGGGSVDLALGHFSIDNRKIIAPFELKGADTKNLDAIMSGRAKSPVDQAWEYATNNVGSKWVLVSNYLEIRLYSYSEGRQAYEAFDLRHLHQPEEYARAQLLLSAESLLGGRTLELLEASRRENKDITDRLYGDYKKLRSDIIGEVRREQPALDPLAAIRIGQTILDRILFIAFAEDTNLLPRNILASAFETTNAFAPIPVWQNFLGLFKAIDEGSPPLKVPRYNGGLFKTNEIINSLAMPDYICEGFKELAKYDFASEVSVTVLGHIFEQSIADVEQLQAEARGQVIAPKKTRGTSGRRKRDGVVYTPDYIARFIVDKTLGTHAQEIFVSLLVEHAAKGASAADDPIKWKSAAAEKAFWRAYRDRLAKLRIVDPACGSGVFLVMAFDWLKAELTRCNTRLEALGEGALFEVDSEILTHNLFGVDVNEESVEIAKLSLWIKTARQGKVLDSLDDNFRVGDSLIETSSYAYRSHGFEWRTAFADIFAEGGFDIVLGNPPYVRQELLGLEIKRALKTSFDVYNGVVDLYAFFFERGLRVLKAGGRIGYISSSTFFKTSSGAPLREYLRTKATLETIVDFGGIQIFEGVTTYPAILTMKTGAPTANHELRYWTVGELDIDNFNKVYEEQAQPYPQNALGNGSWELENSALRALRHKLVTGKPTLKQVYSSPYRGILTGRNKAFVIDRATRDRLIAEDPKSAEVLKPWLEGKDIKKWRAESRDLWVILFKKGATIARYGKGTEAQNWERLQADYPAICKHLADGEQACRKRTDQGDYWWELRACEYYDAFEAPKITYLDMSMSRSFLIDRNASYCANTVYFLPTDDRFALALLNSPIGWFVWEGLSTMALGGVRRLFTYHLDKTPIPQASDTQKAELASLAEAAQSAAEQRYALQQSITRRIPDLAQGAPHKLTERLKSWWDLPNFAAFQAEVKKAFKQDIPLKERTEWENWIAETRQQIHAHTAEITRLETEINTCVYALFDLTSDEIKLLEENV